MFSDQTKVTIMVEGPDGPHATITRELSPTAVTIIRATANDRTDPLALQLMELVYDWVELNTQDPEGR